VKTHLLIHEGDCLIEPSAGNGVFISGMKQLCAHGLFYDVEPEHPEIIPQDYLTWDAGPLREWVSNRNGKIHVIGNPPFGRQSSLAIKFIKKSCEFCHSLSFILPKSFKKESLKKTFPLQFHLEFEMDLPEKSFFVDGIEHDVPCVFQIWENRQTPRMVKEKVEPLHFRFVEKTENPDISFRRVGVNAGKIDTDTNEKSIQSHYFIQFTNNKSVRENVTKLSSITYDFNNTVGPKSISKQELIAKFNPRLDDLS
jgi:predicted RNA methylase